MNKIQDLSNGAQRVVKDILNCEYYHPVCHKPFYHIWAFMHGVTHFRSHKF